MTIRGVIFDMDGVLVDSLPAHLRYCERIAKDFGLDVEVPSPEEFKERIVRSGVRISPMYHFFRALKFPEAEARRADERYRKEFRRELFDGVPRMLEVLAGAGGLALGIVTSNVRNVVERALGEHLKLFRCVFADDDPEGRAKPDALRAAVEAFEGDPESVLFVGDQPSDVNAAREAGVRFLGVTYGWGISEEDAEVERVRSPGEIAQAVMKMRSYL